MNTHIWPTIAAGFLTHQASLVAKSLGVGVGLGTKTNAQAAGLSVFL